MKTVAAALGSTLLGKSFKPVIQVKIDDRRNAGVSPTAWTSWYATAIADVGHCAMVASGGYVSDFRLDTGAGDIYGRRTLAGATPGSTWSKRASTVKTTAQIAACSDPSGNVYLFWIDADEKTVKYKVSDDDGATYGAVQTAISGFNTGYKLNGLAAVCPGYGLHHVVLFVVGAYTTDVTTADKEVWWVCLTDGGWSSPADGHWGQANGKASYGLAAVAFDCDATHSEVTLVLAGKFVTLTSGYNFHAYHVNIDASNADTWTYVGCIKQLTGSNYIAWPSMISESTYDRARVLFQYYDASLPTDKRWQSEQLFIHQLLTGEDLAFGPWQAFRVTNEAYTLGVCRSGDTIYACVADNLWSTPLYDGSSKWLVDVSTRLLSFEHHIFDNALLEDIDFQPGFAYVFLDNHDGAFLDYGEAGATYEAIKRGAQVNIVVGYRTAAGTELEVLPPMWIDKIYHGENPRSGASQDVPHLAVQGGPLLGGRYLILKCYDTWTLTTRRGPTPNTYKSSSAPRDILSETFAQMGIRYTDDGTARLALNGGYPAVTWITQAGTPWYNMIRDILIYCHCRCKFWLEYSQANGGYPTARAYVFEDRDVDPVDLSVGGTSEMTLYAGIYYEQERWGGYQYEWYEPAFVPTTILQMGAVTGAAVEGKDTADHDIDYSRVKSVGYWQPRRITDFQVSATTYITAAARAEAASDDEPLYGGQVLIPLHPCLEVWDRIQVTDGGACQAVQKRHVIGIESFYDVKGKRGRYEQVVHLMRHVRA